MEAGKLQDFYQRSRCSPLSIKGELSARRALIGPAASTGCGACWDRSALWHNKKGTNVAKTNLYTINLSNLGTSSLQRGILLICHTSVVSLVKPLLLLSLTDRKTNLAITGASSGRLSAVFPPVHQTFDKSFFLKKKCSALCSSIEIYLQTPIELLLMWFLWRSQNKCSKTARRGRQSPPWLMCAEHLAVPRLVKATIPGSLTPLSTPWLTWLVWHRSVSNKHKSIEKAIDVVKHQCVYSENILKFQIC